MPSPEVNQHIEASELLHRTLEKYVLSSWTGEYNFSHDKVLFDYRSPSEDLSPEGIELLNELFRWTEKTSQLVIGSLFEGSYRETLSSK